MKGENNHSKIINSKKKEKKKKKKKKEKNQRNCRNKMKNIKYCTVGTVSKIIKSNRKGTETGKVDTPNTQLHERSLSWHGTGPSIKKVAGLN